MSIALLCRKLGMTRIFNETGASLPVTVLEAKGNAVVQKKVLETDGYSAVQLGFGERPTRTADQALAGHFKKAKVAPKRTLAESRLTDEEVAGYEVGQEIDVDIFNVGQHVDVTGTSKGRGTAGVIKRHGFSMPRQTHGTHENFRHGGAIGAGSYPGRVIKGMKMPGRMGNERVTTQNLEVVRIDAENSLIFVKGGVPGHNNSIVRIQPTVTSQT